MTIPLQGFDAYQVFLLGLALRLLVTVILGLLISHIIKTEMLVEKNVISVFTSLRAAYPNLPAFLPPTKLPSESELDTCVVVVFLLFYEERDPALLQQFGYFQLKFSRK